MEGREREFQCRNYMVLERVRLFQWERLWGFGPALRNLVFHTCEVHSIFSWFKGWNKKILNWRIRCAHFYVCFFPIQVFPICRLQSSIQYVTKFQYMEISKESPSTLELVKFVWHEDTESPPTSLCARGPVNTDSSWDLNGPLRRDRKKNYCDCPNWGSHEASLINGGAHPPSHQC